MSGDKITKKDLAHKLRVDPRQRFYLRAKECQTIIDIIVDKLKDALREGKTIELDTFGKIFMDELGPRRLYNYKLHQTIDIPVSYMAKVKLRKQLKYEIKQALKEKRNA